MSKYESPEMPFIEARYQGGKQNPTAIILRGTMTTSDVGAALGFAQMWHRSPDPWKSGHYTVDEGSRYRCVLDDVVAGDKTCNDKGAIRIAVCGEPFSRTEFWNEEAHRAVLFRTAKLVAELTLLHKIKVTYLTDSKLEKWRKHPWRSRGGIIIDTPEGWPWQAFMNEVLAQRALKTFI